MKLFYTILFSLVCGIAMSQDVSLVEQFAGEDEGATARSMGVAGAFGAVGADFSAATNNPAGMAFFRKKELGLGLGFQERNIDADYLNQIDANKSSILRLQNIGFNYSELQTEWIGDSLAVKRKGLVSWSIAAGMNQKADYDEVVSYDAVNPSSSLLTSYVQSANQYGLSTFESQALSVGLLETTQSGGNTFYTSPLAAGGLAQNGQILREGARRDFFISGGVNLDNKLYLGATLDVPWVHYEERLVFQESDINNKYADFSSYDLRESRSYDGVGGSLGLGAIYRVNDYFRAGLKVKTPTVIEIDQETSIQTRAAGNSASPDDRFVDNYLITLPWNAGLQLVGSHPKYGLISLEADYVDYSAARISYLEDDFGDFDEYEDAFKEDAKYYYKGAFNFRGGLEGRLFKNFRLRGGAAYNMSPYENEADEFGADYSRLTLALGAGYRHEPSNLTFDLGVNRVTTGEFNSAYLVNNIPNSVISDEETFLVRLNVSKRFNQ